LHKVQIIKKDGKIIKKPYKIVYKKTSKSSDPKAKKTTEIPVKSHLATKLDSAPIKPPKRLVRCETNPPTKLLYPSIEKPKERKEGRERASYTPPPQENHIHYHHYYIFNQGP